MRSTKKLILALIFSLWLPSILSAGSIHWQGQFSGWLLMNDDKQTNAQAGLRYIPTLNWEKSIGSRRTIDFELAVNGYQTIHAKSFEDFESSGKIKPYRGWLRFATPQLELRLGLQKINFGSSTMLRPLMWFDQIDPRDPLQLTDGVYALLGRYYFLNNTNIWLWGLYGNKDLKGWEVIPSDKNSIEYGGRLQLPLFTGELGFTYHHRQMDLNQVLFIQLLRTQDLIPEDRFALDGKWDVEIGCWFESVLIHQHFDWYPIDYQQMLTLGADYTFSLGNGLHLLGEQIYMKASEKILGRGETQQFSALLADYPIGLFDQVMAIFYYDWENENLYRFCRWQKTFNKWSFHLIGFWNPAQYLLYQTTDTVNYYAGKGLQFLMVYQH